MPISRTVQTSLREYLTKETVCSLVKETFDMYQIEDVQTINLNVVLPSSEKNFQVLIKQWITDVSTFPVKANSYDTFEFVVKQRFIKPVTTFKISLDFYKHKIFLKGRYMKDSRNVYQSRWSKNDIPNGKISIEQLLGDECIKFWKAQDYTLHASGREDVDVRMLGTGRPFILRLIKPLRSIPKTEENENISIQEIQDILNVVCQPYGVQCLNLSCPNLEGNFDNHAARQLMLKLHHSAEEKEKMYRCFCSCESSDQEITESDLSTLKARIQNLEISQLTPTRVSHRRALLSRKRKLTCLDACVSGKNTFELVLKADAGTYIKEFVHGDSQRTNPNVSSLLGIPVIINNLDVLGLHMSSIEL